MKSNFKENFNFITNILIIFLLVFSGFVWADSNGVWTLAKDIRGGIIGSDEQTPNMNYSFINAVNFFNPVYFYNKLKSNDNNYYINISGRTQLNDLATQKIASNYGKINGNLYVQNNLTLKNKINCNGKLYTDSTGKILCGIDNVNDGDNNSTNELQNLNQVLSKGSNGGGYRITNITNPVSNQDVATKNYVDSKISSSGQTVYSCPNQRAADESGCLGQITTVNYCYWCSRQDRGSCKGWTTKSCNRIGTLNQ